MQISPARLHAVARLVGVLGRRGVLLGALTLAGCAAAPRPNASSSSSSTSTATGSSTPGRHTAPAARPTHASPVAHSSASSARPEPPLPTRTEIQQRFGHRVPRQWGLEVSGMVLRLPRPAVRAGAVALTFDACGAPTSRGPGQGVDAHLLDVLRQHESPATLFLNERWVRAHPDLARELADDPLFELANHGTLHRPLSVDGRAAYGIVGTHSVGEVYDEVAGNTARLTELVGHRPRFFRSGTAHCDDVAVEIVAALGQTVVNFSVNGDFGATATRRQVAAALDATRAGDIVIGHMNHPEGATAEGVAQALPRLLDRGLQPVRLGDYL